MNIEYTPKSDFEKEVRDFCDNSFSGIGNFHIHGDRAYTRRDKYYAHHGVSVDDIARRTLPEKQRLTWVLHKGPGFTSECIEERMRRLLEESIRFGVRKMYTTIDATHNTEFKSLEIAEKLKVEYKGRIDLFIGAYNPSGFKDSDPRRYEIFEEAARRSDFIVGLAEKDRKDGHIGERQHNWYVLQLGYRLGKPMQFHVGQENRPGDMTTETLLSDLEFLQDIDLRVSPERFPQIDMVHVISSSAKPYDEFLNTARRMAERGVGIVCCPRAASSMLQDFSINAPIHNSIARIWDFAVNGVNIRGFGVDNLDDIYVPASSPDVYDDLEDAANLLRFYNQRILAKILCGEPLDPFDVGTIQRDLFSK
ncbi:hypothetical protein J4218_01990 [Candidatus Pacearchaeota archaeon]|nr:hypothetical protein [uncultured archaeon]AQS29122.1 hypothetical protein [uncultured archaeon]MBS3078868.1 hypothetical protein [Candidatus Pacearchaeota archaeon]